MIATMAYYRAQARGFEGSTELEDWLESERAVDQLLEERLTDEISNQAAMEEAESYMLIIEGIFDETSETSLNSMVSDYWNASYDLSNNPLGTSERALLYEKGVALTEQFNTISSDLLQIEQDLTDRHPTDLFRRPAEFLCQYKAGSG